MRSLNDFSHSSMVRLTLIQESGSQRCWFAAMTHSLRGVVFCRLGLTGSTLLCDYLLKCPIVKRASHAIPSDAAQDKAHPLRQRELLGNLYKLTLQSHSRAFRFA